MADLGNLWFSLGLDDSKFEKQWKDALAKYGKDTKMKIDVEISQKTIESLKKLKDMGGSAKEWKAVREAAKAATEFAKGQAKANAELAKTEALQRRLQSSNNNQAASVRNITKGYQTQSLWLTNLSTMASNYLSLFAAKEFVTNLARISGEFEIQRKTLQAMIGEFEGSTLYSQIKELSVMSPFQFKDLASYTKQLAAFSVPYNELYDTTKSLADISAGLGVDMSRIILAYGQIRSAGVLKGTELRQLTEAGVPILEKLAEKFTQLEGQAVSVGDVFGKISQKLVPFAMVKDIFAELTSEGGKFYNMQEIQSQTLAGRISNLTDAYQIMLSELGEQNEGALKGGVNILYKLIDNYELVGGAIKTVAMATAGYQAAQMLAFGGPVLKKAGAFVTVIARLHGNLIKATSAMQMLNIATKASAWGVLLSVILGLGTAIYQVYQSSKRFNDEMDKMLNADLSKLRDEQYALEKLKKATEEAAIGSHDRREAINKINSRYGEYLDNMLTEASTADEIAAAYNRITEAMQNKFKQESLEKAKANVEEEYGDDINDAISALEKRFSNAGLTKIEGQDLTKLFRAYFESGKFNEAEIKKIFTDRVGKTLGVFDYNEALNFDLHDLQKAIKEYQKAMKDAEDSVNLRYSPATYSTKAEADFVKSVNKAYAEQVALLNTGVIPAEERKEKLIALEAEKYQKLAEAYADPEFLNNPAKAKEYLSLWNGLIKTVTDWEKKIKDVTKGNTALFEFNPKENSQLSEYLKSLQERYDDLLATKKLLESKIDSKQDVVGAKKELDIINAKIAGAQKVASTLNFKLTDTKGDKANDKAEREGLRQDQILQNWQNKLDKFKTEVGLKLQELNTNLASISFDDIDTDGIAAKLSKIDAEFNKANVDIEKYKEKLIASWKGILQAEAKWKGETFQGDVTFDMLPEEAQKVIDIYNQLIAKKKEYDEALLNQSVIDKYASIEKRKQDILKDAFAEFEIAYNGGNFDNFDTKQWSEALKKALEAVNRELDPITKKIFKDLKYQTRDEIGKSIKDATDKLNSGLLSEDDSEDYLSRVLELRKAYEDLGKVDITTNISELINKKDELKILKKQIEATTDPVSLEKLNNEYDKKSKDYKLSIAAFGAEQFAQGLSKAASAMKELASATGDADLDKTAEQFENLGNTISAAVQGLATAGPWGALAGGLMAIISNTINGIIQAKIYNEQLVQSIKDYNNEVLRLKLTLNEDDYDTIFGVNALSKVNEAAKKAQDALQNYNNAVNKKFNKPSFDYTKKARITKELRLLNEMDWDAYERGLTELQAIRIKTKDRSGFAEFFGAVDKFEHLKDFAPNLWDLDGTFNVENAEAFLKTNNQIDDAQRKQIQNAIDLQKTYEENLQVVSEYLENIFSDTSKTITDSMIDAFARTGDAAFELGDIVNDVARNMASDLVQSLLLDQYLTPAMDRIKKMYDATSDGYEEDSEIRTLKAIEAMREGIAAAQQAVPEVNRILENIESMGIDLSSGTESASQVLSGLTEDQQNLIVGYINGIRADVSINKGILASIANSTGTISNNIALALVVWKQIEANTHRSADGVDRIIGYFESVIGAYDGGGGQAIRVNIA